MRKSATTKVDAPPATGEDFFVRFTIDALLGLMTDLCCRVEEAGTRREASQVLLAKAHIDEAVGLLRTIQPVPIPREIASARRMLSPAPLARSLVQQPRRPHQARGLAS